MKFYINKKFETMTIINFYPEDLLSNIEDDDILKYCYKNNLIEPKTKEDGSPIYPKLDENHEITNPSQYNFSYGCDIDITADEDYILEDIDESTLRQFVFNNKIVDISDLDKFTNDFDESELISYIVDLIKSRHRGYMDKNDLKKELSDMIDLWIN